MVPIGGGCAYSRGRLFDDSMFRFWHLSMVELNRGAAYKVLRYINPIPPGVLYEPHRFFQNYSQTTPAQWLKLYDF